MSEATTIRPAGPSDYDHFLRLSPELEVDDPVLDAARWQDDMMPSTFIAERAGRVVAYSFFQVLRDIGYVRHVVVAPEARGQGLGVTMMRALADHFRAQGARSWCLNVKPNNAPAIRLYERVGMRAAYVSTALRLRWELIGAMPKDDEGSRSRSIAAEEDAAVEAAFELPSGLLADYRRQGKRVLVGLDDPQTGARFTPLGVAAFDPTYPGAFPFRVRRPALAGALFRALRPYALSHHDYIQIVIENDAALTRGLIDAGASIALEMVHYRGDLSGGAGGAAGSIS